MFEALLAWVAAWLRRRFARAQLTAAFAEPVQDRLATLLAAQDDFLKQVERNEAKHQEQMAALSSKHQEQMAELFRRVSAPQLSWGQPAGLLSFGEENAAQCASEPEEELGEHGLAQLAIADRDDSMGAEQPDDGDSDSASPDLSMTTAGPVTLEMLASTHASPARPPGPGRAPTPTKARARGSGQKRPTGEGHYRQNPRYVRALQLYLEGRLSAEECLRAAGFDRITASEKGHLQRLARQARAADPSTGGVAVAVASKKGSKAKTVSKTLPKPFRLSRRQVRRPLCC